MASLGVNIIANYVGRTWTALLGLLFIPIYLKFLGIEAYGLLGVHATISSVIGILDLGIGATMNRELARLSARSDAAYTQRDLVRTFETIYWGLAIIAGITIYFCAPYLATNWVKAQNLASATVLSAVRLMAFVVILQFPVSLYQGGLMGLQRQVLVNGILVFTGTLRSVGAILILWLVSPTIEAFLIWQLVSASVNVGLFLAGIWRSLPAAPVRPRFRGEILLGVWRYSAAIFANAVIGIVLTQLDKIILSRMLSLEMFGYYSLSATVASAIWMVIIPFYTAIFPRFVQLNESGNTAELRELFHRSAQTLAVLLLPVCAMLIVFSREVLALWMQNPLVVEHCHAIVSLLVLGTMLNGIVSIIGYSASAFGWPQLVTYTNTLQAVLIIPLIIGMVTWRQGIGAAIAWVLLNSTYVVFMAPVYFRHYLREERASWYGCDVAVPIVAAFTVCVCSRFAMPGNLPTWGVSGWLIGTAFATVVATGCVLPRVRTVVYSRVAGGSSHNIGETR